MNKVILVGRVGKDVETRTIDGGTMVSRVSLATSEKYKKKNGDVEEKTQWHNIVLWSGLADIAAKYVKKGDRILIEGKVEYRSWEKDGKTNYTTEILATQLEMLGGPNGSKPANNSANRVDNEKEMTAHFAGTSNDLPF